MKVVLLSVPNEGYFRNASSAINLIPTIVLKSNVLFRYSDTCLNPSSLRPTFMFGIDRYSVYTG